VCRCRWVKDMGGKATFYGGRLTLF